MRRAVAIGLVLLAAAAFYLLLIDTASLPELYAGAGVLAVSAITLVATCEPGFPQLDLRTSWLVRSWRAVVKVPIQIAIVSAAAFAQLVHRRQSRGRIRTVRFRGGEEPFDHGRAALATLFGSLAPNGIVLGTDRQKGILVVHQLHPTGGREELDVLELG